MKKKYNLTLLFIISSYFINAQIIDSCYIDFFGHKYSLETNFEKLNYLDQYGTYIKNHKHNTFSYEILGKQFLIKKTETIEDPENPGAYIIQTKYHLTKELLLSNVVDSLEIRNLDFEKDFKIKCGTETIRIYRFKLIADNSLGETEFISTDKGLAYNMRTTEKNIKSCLDKLENNKYILLSELYYYDPKEKKDYLLDFTILLKK